MSVRKAGQEFRKSRERNKMRNIYRSKKHTALFEILEKSKNPNTGESVFPTVKALQCYAAMLGFEEGRRIPLENGEKDSIEWHTMKNDGYIEYIYMIALAETQNLGVLRYNEEDSDTGGFSEDMVKIFEEYANGGFHILQNWLDKYPGDPYGAKAIIAGLQRSEYLANETAREKFDEVEF